METQSRLQKSVDSLLASPYRAFGFALVFSILPFFSWIAQIFSSVVVLRKSFWEGLFVSLATSLPGMAIILYTGKIQAGLYLLLTVFLTWLCSFILRQSESWNLVMIALIAGACFVVGGLHLYFGDMASFWLAYAKKAGPFLQQFAGGVFSSKELMHSIENLAPLMTGMQCAMLILSLLFNLGLARFLQYQGVNAPRLRKELLSLKLEPLLFVAWLLALGAVYWGSPWALDLLPILSLPICVVGTVVVNKLAVGRYRRRILGLYYILLVFMLVQMLWILALLVLADLVFDFGGNKDGSYFA